MANAAETASVIEQVGNVFDPGKMSGYLDIVMELAIQYGLKLIAAVAIFIIGKMVANWIKKLVIRFMKKSNVDPIIIGFTSSITYIAILTFVVVAAIGQLGIQTTSFIAIIGAAGLAIGLALQGSLANFAAGFLLIIFRPFKVGDVIEAAGVTGKVNTIHIFTTTLTTGDNKTIIIPNAKLSNNNIINYSTQETRRVDITIGVSYDADLKKVRTILEDIVSKDERILKEPSHLIAVSELAGNSVNFAFRLWVKSADYWGVFFDINESVKIRFDEAGIGLA
ncbi:small-conductance mechanosensitive channel [bacterium BMS3Abin11]|nr:small-conductance mechanosensitive channel [bacterium BMS3Abin11]GMT40964.1 MAG: mechanosensitive ion channel protein [bacterium]